MGLDIQTSKGENLENLMLKDLNGLSRTYLECTALRIDVSKVGFSNDGNVPSSGFVDSKIKKEGAV